MKMYLISDNVDTLTGMKIAGFDGVVAHTETEVKESLEKCFSDSEIGILLITEKIEEDFRETINSFKENRRYPIIVSVPDRHGSRKGNDYITEFVAQSVGLKL